MTKIDKNRLEERIKFWETKAIKIDMDLQRVKHKWRNIFSELDKWRFELERWNKNHA